MNVIIICFGVAAALSEDDSWGSCLDVYYLKRCCFSNAGCTSAWPHCWSCKPACELDSCHFFLSFGLIPLLVQWLGSLCWMSFAASRILNLHFFTLPANKAVNRFSCANCLWIALCMERLWVVNAIFSRSSVFQALFKLLVFACQLFWLCRNFAPSRESCL